LPGAIKFRLSPGELGERLHFARTIAGKFHATTFNTSCGVKSANGP
jgi:hypothetical protein